jgi:hypothetical protein
MSRIHLTWDRLPLFATDEEIGEAVLGRDPKREFADMAQLHERDGMPKICPVFGGRYVPAVKACFDAQYGLSAAVPFDPNGIEGSFHGNSRRAPERQRPQVAKATDRPSSPVLVR